MSKIRILPEAIANRIAAGEVVERPASVVKELLENALDAGARSVRIEVESGGKRMIRVVDDGCGMSHDDALLAFERHATSKLRTSDDLLSIATLGFRGEALPSIASVARLLLETCIGGEEQGTRVEFAGGKLVGVKPAGLPAGSSVSVADLFYCVPARRKFLKSDTTELGHVASLVTHYALANPDKHFALKTPTQEIMNVPPVATLAERVYQLFGRQALEEMIEIAPVSAPVRAAITEPAMDSAEHAGELIVRGFVSRPEVQRANRNGIYIFVNRRLVRDRLILHAIHEAYRNILPADVFPVALLFIDLPSEEVDVNVHPAKIEVRFRHSQCVHDFARDTIRQALSKARPIASFAMPNRSASSNPSQGGVAAAVAPAPMAPPRGALPSMAPFGGASSEGFALTEVPVQPETQRFAFETIPPESLGDNRGGIADQFSEASQQVQQTMEAPASAICLGELKPLGQVNASFIVAVNSEGLWIIDQHVAHERVLFEQHLRSRREGVLTGQRLLVPIVVDLTPRQCAILEQISEELTANGFEVTARGPPAGVANSDGERLLAEILDGIEREHQAISIDSLQSRIAASTACHAAIKVNMPLDQTKMEWLLGELAKTESPMSCPHGRPVILRYSLREIERAFKRI
jgi:DNA mismatch repair protein MutL